MRERFQDSATALDLGLKLAVSFLLMLSSAHSSSRILLLNSSPRSLEMISGMPRYIDQWLWRAFATVRASLFGIRHACAHFENAQTITIMYLVTPDSVTYGPIRSMWMCCSGKCGGMCGCRGGRRAEDGGVLDFWQVRHVVTTLDTSSAMPGQKYLSLILVMVRWTPPWPARVCSWCNLTTASLRLAGTKSKCSNDGPIKNNRSLMSLQFAVQL